MYKILSRPNIHQLSEVPEIINQFCYVFDNCTDNGFSMLISQSDDVIIKFGEFDGTEIDITKEHKHLKYISAIMQDNIYKFLEIINTIRIKMVQLFFVVDDNNQLRLIEAMTHLNKYQSPGMLRDVFAKAGISTPNVNSIEIINLEAIERLKSGKYVLYPSSPKFITRNNDSELLRARIC